MVQHKALVDFCHHQFCSVWHPISPHFKNLHTVTISHGYTLAIGFINAFLLYKSTSITGIWRYAWQVCQGFKQFFSSWYYISVALEDPLFIFCFLDPISKSPLLSSHFWAEGLKVWSAPTKVLKQSSSWQGSFLLQFNWDLSNANPCLGLLNKDRWLQHL